MKQLITVMAFSLAALASLAVSAGGPADPLRSRLDDIKTLQGDFVQSLLDEDGELIEESSGTFAMQRPGRFRFDTTEPFEQLLVSDGETIWLYEPDLAQVTVREVDDDLQRTPALLISGDLTDLRENFRITRVREDGSERYELQPRDAADLFEQLELVFVDDSLVEVAVRDSLGQLTRFELQQTQRNRELDAALFRFEPPDDADVLID